MFLAGLDPDVTSPCIVAAASRKGARVKTVGQVSELAGVSIRTLRYYDKIGLLSPSSRSDAGYRLYSDDDLRRLQQILLFRELEFSLEDIRRVLDSPGFDRERALDQQVELLRMRRQHLDDLIGLAESLRGKEDGTVSFEAFDTGKIDEYTRRAKQEWGNTQVWGEFEEKHAGRTHEQEVDLGSRLMQLFVPFGSMAKSGADAACAQAQQQAAKIQAFITDNYYTCTDEIFAQLGAAYGAGGEFTSNINAVAGDGAAEFAASAIAHRFSDAASE